MEKPYRIIIAGSRDFNDYVLLKTECDKFIAVTPDDRQIVIISGGAKGADSLGEQYAREHGLQIRRFPADWNRFGKSAGPRRNVEMAQNADALIAFWDGQSRGTKHMVKTAMQKENSVNTIRIVRY